ncbi:MAG: domain containing protein [Myxococcales bacterium]|nr:domain containing protein [Myxococcales bacterium]
MDAVEVVARLGSTTLSIRYLGVGETYRIGTAPGLDLALRVATSFPLVERGVVRIPAGATATVFDAGLASPLAGRELWLAARVRVEVQIGLVSITIARVRTSAMPLPRVPLEARPYLYATASLGAHLLVWALAITFAPQLEPAEKLPVPPRVRVTHVPQAPPEPKPDPTMIPAVATASADPTAAPPPAAPSENPQVARRRRAVSEAREAGMLGSDGLDDMPILVRRTDVEGAFEVGQTYHEEDADPGFAGGPRWNPGTIAAGAYATVSEGRGAGEDYDLPGAVAEDRHVPVVEMCTGRPCVADGPISRAVIANTLEDHALALLRCYRHKAEPRSRGTVTLDFEIDRNGEVLRASAHGFGEVAPCVLTVLESIDFPIAPGEPQTTVQFSLGFR